MDTAVRVPEGLAAAHNARRLVLLGLACAGASATVSAAAIAVGVYAHHRQPGERFGLVLVAAGGAWFVTTLAESQDGAVYTVGRAAGWLTEALIVYLFLCFPTGRLPERADRTIARALAAVVAVFYLPQLLVAQDFSVPSPYTSCVEACPGNALFALDREPAFVDGLMRPLGAVLVLAVMVAVVVRLRRRCSPSRWPVPERSAC